MSYYGSGDDDGGRYVDPDKLEKIQRRHPDGPGAQEKAAMVLAEAVDRWHRCADDASWDRMMVALDDYRSLRR